MISYDEALGLVRQSVASEAGVVLSLEKACGRRLSSSIVAAIDSPAFDNSAMDGYAVGSVEGPWTISGVAAAGEVPGPLEPGKAARIFTGAMTPRGTAAVIPQEDCIVAGHALSAAELVKPGAHIRRQAEEFETGFPLLEAGIRLTPPILSSLAAQGFAQVAVKSLPRVGVLCTGSELIALGQACPPGRIYESNGLAIQSLMEGLGCSVKRAVVRDELEETQRAAADLLKEADLLVSVGGVSVGDFDFIRPGMEALGFQTVFAGVKIKPGKPVAFAMRADGKAWFALPGNPISALTTCCLFVLPYLGEELRFSAVALSEDLVRKQGREEFYPASMRGGATRVQSTVGSHSTHGLAAATGLARIPAEAELLLAGTPVLYADLPWRPV